MGFDLQSHVVSACRICRSKKLHCYLELGKTPLANSYLKDKQLGESEFTEQLAVLFCENCSHSQLSHVVHPDLMFKHYHYVSSTPDTFHRHCEAWRAVRPGGLPLR